MDSTQQQEVATDNSITSLLGESPDVTIRRKPKADNRPLLIIVGLYVYFAWSLNGFHFMLQFLQLVYAMGLLYIVFQDDKDVVKLVYYTTLTITFVYIVMILVGGIALFSVVDEEKSHVCLLLHIVVIQLLTLVYFIVLLRDYYVDLNEGSVHLRLAGPIEIILGKRPRSSTHTHTDVTQTSQATMA